VPATGQHQINKLTSNRTPDQEARRGHFQQHCDKRAAISKFLIGGTVRQFFEKSSNKIFGIRHMSATDNADDFRRGEQDHQRCRWRIESMSAAVLMER